MWWMLALPAGASPLIEAPPFSHRSQARALVQAGSRLGLHGRISKVPLHGGDVHYIVSFVGFTDAAEAELAAHALVDRSGVAFWVMADTVAPEWVDAPFQPREQTDTETLLSRAWRAHGSRSEPDPLSEAEALVFRYRRFLDDRTALHTWARRGDALYHQVVGELGDIQDSVTHVVEGDVYLAGQRIESGDPGQVERFGPSNLLALPLGLSALLSPGARSGFALDPDGDAEGLAWLVLPARSLRVGISGADSRVRAVVFGAGASARSVRFSDYAELSPSLVIPRSITHWRGKTLIDRIQVLSLDVGTPVPEEWFSQSGAGAGDLLLDSSDGQL